MSTISPANFIRPSGTVPFTGNQDLGGNKLTGLGAPTNPNDSCTKAYADAIANGLSVKDSVDATTVAPLATNIYNNGSSGVGATLTGVSLGALTIDGYAVQLNDRLLIKNEVTASHNGLYVCTTLGTTLAVYVLTRSADSNTSAEIIGSFVFTENGTVNDSSGFVCINATTITIGTTSIAYTQFSSAGSVPVFGASGGSHSTGLVPDPGSSAGTTRFLREDATFAVPPGSTLSLTPVAPGSVGNNVVFLDNTTYEISIKDTTVSSVLTTKRIEAFYAVNGCSFVLTDNGSKGNPLHIAITTSLKSGSGVSFCLFGWTRAVAYGSQIQSWAGQINFGTRANESYMGAYFNGPAQYGVYASDGTSQFEADGSNTVASLPPYSRKNANPQVGIWDFNSAVYDNSTGKLYTYCNGILNGTPTTGAPNNSCNTDFTIGGTANPTTPWSFNGTIAMVGKVTGINSTNGPAFFLYMWNKGLGRSKESILNYLSINSLSSPDCLYAFDDPTGTHGLGTDSSANANHLTSLYTTPPYVGLGPGASYNY